MSKENETKEPEASTIVDFSGRFVRNCWPTAYLRYAEKQIMVDGNVRHELRLQQMWQYQDGKLEWKWVDNVEDAG